MEKPQGTDVTIRDIAAAVGCSHASVSRALRGEPKVSPDLRKRVKETAKAMGYKPNPLVASLMAGHNTKKARQSLSANIGWLNMHPNPDFWHVYPHNKRYFDAAKERALERGFGFDEVWAREPGMTGQRLEQILNTRGIHGLLVSNVSKVLDEMQFDISKYAVAAIGPEHEGQMAWNRAGISHRINAEIAFDRLRALGCKRIGYALAIRGATPQTVDAFNRGKPDSDEIVRFEGSRAELAGIYFRQNYVPVEERIPPFIYDRDEEDTFVDSVADWIIDSDVDAIICHDNQVFAAAELAGKSIPDDICLAHLGLSDEVEDWAGIDIHPEQQAQAAVEMLSSSVQYNQRGIPESPRTIHVRGMWRDGWTATQRA